MTWVAAFMLLGQSVAASMFAWVWWRTRHAWVAIMSIGLDLMVVRRATAVASLEGQQWTRNFDLLFLPQTITAFVLLASIILVADTRSGRFS